MELQGSGVFAGDPWFPPPPEPQIQVSSMEPSHSGGPLPTISMARAAELPGEGYQTQDVFAASGNPFLETLRQIAMNPSQMNAILNASQSNLPTV